MTTLDTFISLCIDNLDKVKAGTGKRSKTWIQQQLDDIAPDVFKQYKSAPKCLVALVKLFVTTPAEAKRVLPDVKKIVYALSSSLNTTQKTLSIFNMMFIDSPDIHKISKSIMRLTDEDTISRKATGAAQLHKKSTNRVTIPYKKVLDAIRIGIISTDFATLQSALSLSCGPRIIELLCKRVAVFLPHPKKKDWIIQKGVAKTPDGINKIVYKPLLGIEYKQWIDGYNRFHLMIGDRLCGLDNIAITSTYMVILTRRAHELFPEHKRIRGTCGTHTFREIYCVGSYTHTQHLDMNINAWGTMVLGHNTADSSKHYNSIVLS